MVADSLAPPVVVEDYNDVRILKRFPFFFLFFLTVGNIKERWKTISNYDKSIYLNNH